MASSDASDIASKLNGAAGMRFSQIVVGPSSLLPHDGPDFELRSARAEGDRLDLEFVEVGESKPMTVSVHQPAGLSMKKAGGFSFTRVGTVTWGTDDFAPSAVKPAFQVR